MSAFIKILWQEKSITVNDTEVHLVHLSIFKRDIDFLDEYLFPGAIYDWQIVDPIFIATLKDNNVATKFGFIQRERARWREHGMT